jgi:hypothetical protein
MSRKIATIKNIWDKTTQTDNKLTISNRFAKIIETIRENHYISEGKAIEGLIDGTYKYEEVLIELKKHYHDI